MIRSASKIKRDRKRVKDLSWNEEWCPNCHSVTKVRPSATTVVCNGCKALMLACANCTVEKCSICETGEGFVNNRIEV